MINLRPLQAKSPDDDRQWIAHFGGSFNPVHDGHIGIGRTLLEEYRFDRVVYVPTSSHYPKPGIASEIDRFDMLHASIATESRFELCDYELGRNVWTEPYETILFLKERYKQADHSPRIFTVRGDDWLPEMLHWSELADHVGIYEFVIVPRVRPRIDTKSSDQVQVALIEHLSFEMRSQSLLDASSHSVKGKIANHDWTGIPCPPAVLEIIRRRGLYGARYRAPRTNNS